MAGLTIAGLEKRYGGTVALGGAGLEARPGEVHALLGENGAGKSTLIKILAGAVRRDAGTIRLDDRELALGSPAEAQRRGIAAAFQELSLVPDLTVAQNLLYGREPLTPLRTVSRSRLVRRARAVLDDVGIEGIDAASPVSALPIAQRQLLEIAKAVSREPQVLIFDEATSALSPREGGWLLELARRMAREGRIVIFISHRLAEIRAVADRVTVFRGGVDVGAAPIEQMTDDEAVRLMLGRRIERLYPERRGGRPSDDVVLRVRQLRLGRRLRGVDLDLHRGEILGVGGLQGQGQLELFAALVGARQAEGTTEIDGSPVRLRSPREALDAGVALVPEDRQREGLLLNLPIRANVSLPVLDRISRFGLVDRAEEQRMVDEVATQLQISSGSWERPASSLSGGNQQKVVLAKLLVSKARVLLLYDATRGVDVGTKFEIFSLLRRLSDEGVSSLFYSTDLQELAHVCDRVAVMVGGRIGGELVGAEIGEEQILRLSVGAERAAGAEAV